MSDFASVCEQSTDFHFPTLEQQFEKISVSLTEANEDRVRQRCGEEEADRASVGSATGSISSADVRETISFIKELKICLSM